MNFLKIIKDTTDIYIYSLDSDMEVALLFFTCITIIFEATHGQFIFLRCPDEYNPIDTTVVAQLNILREGVGLNRLRHSSELQQTSFFHVQSLYEENLCQGNTTYEWNDNREGNVYGARWTQCCPTASLRCHLDKPTEISLYTALGFVDEIMLYSEFDLNFIQDAVEFVTHEFKYHNSQFLPLLNQSLSFIGAAVNRNYISIFVSSGVWHTDCEESETTTTTTTSTTTVTTTTSTTTSTTTTLPFNPTTSSDRSIYKIETLTALLFTLFMGCHTHS